MAAVYGCESAVDAVGMLKSQAVSRVDSGLKDIAIRFDNKAAFDMARTLLFDTGGMKEVLKHVNASCERQVYADRYIRYINEHEMIIHISMIFSDPGPAAETVTETVTETETVTQPETVTGTDEDSSDHDEVATDLLL